MSPHYNFIGQTFKDLLINFKAPDVKLRAELVVDHTEEESYIKFNSVLNPWIVENSEDPLVDLLYSDLSDRLEYDTNGKLKNVLNEYQMIYRSASKMRVELLSCVVIAVNNKIIPTPKGYTSRTKIGKHPTYQWVDRIIGVENNVDPIIAESIIKIYKVLKGPNPNREQIGLVLCALQEKQSLKR